MLPIEKKFVKYNYTSAPGRTIEYVIVHDTANTGYKADANAHFNYFNGGNRNASADFFVDDSRIVQIIDYKNCYSWAVGDGHGNYGITNRNSVSLELCINSDGNYDKTFENAVELAVYLLKSLGLPLSRLKRHYDASRKYCPNSMSANNWARWNEFVRRATELYNNGTVTPAPVPPSGNGGVSTDETYTGMTLHLPATSKSWNVYNVGGPYTIGNEVGKLTPSQYGGLNYKILGSPEKDVYFIQTGDYGKVAIYAGSDTSATISNGGGSSSSSSSSSTGKKLHLPATSKSWNVYNPNGPYTVGNEIAKLTPAQYGGLTYDILGSPTTNVYLIQTSNYGKVAIYAGPDTSATITGGGSSSSSSSSVNGEYLEKSYSENGVATVTASSLNIRNTHYASGNTPVGTYDRGSSFNYDSVYVTNKYVYCSYISYSGNRRYVAVKNLATGERYATCR